MSADDTTLEAGLPHFFLTTSGLPHGEAFERWRTLLWYLEVEGMKPREIAPLMGMTPNAVSVLAVARAAKRGLKA